MLPNRLSSALKIAILWFTIGAFQAVYEYAVLYNYEVVPEWFDFWALFRIFTLAPFMTGILAGLFLFPRINHWLRTHSYGRAILYSLLSVTLLYFIMNIFSSFSFNLLKYDSNVFDPIVQEAVIEYLTGTENLKNYLLWVLIGVFTIVGIHIQDKYGPGNFSKFLLGKYFHPKEEHQIFMFLDIRSSTTIAEKLEELQYFEFLKDFFNDVTPAILNAKGKIYKYIGDEIVVHWSFKEGFEHNNCINAFFNAEDRIKQRAAYYQEKYGLVPSFKTGLHYGKAVVGEMGMIKRDIAFSGDVLNTASRIQSLCNEMGVDMLISENIYKHLDLKNMSYEVSSVGEVALKGKINKLEIYKVL